MGKQLDPAHDHGTVKSCDAVSSKRLEAFSELQYDHPENSHDCCRAPGKWNFTSDGAERSADGLWPAALMAAVGLAAAGGIVVRPSTATGTCMATIRTTATTGIGITK
jgi:hypothetical protein